MPNTLSIWGFFQVQLIRVIQQLSEGQVIVIALLLMAIVIAKYVLEQKERRQEENVQRKLSVLAKNLVKTSTLLLQEKKKFETIVNLINEEIAIIDLTGSLIWVNQNLKKNLGEVSDNQEICKNYFSLSWEALEAAGNDESRATITTTHISKEGKKSEHFAVIAAPLPDEEGNTMAYAVSRRRI